MGIVQHDKDNGGIDGTIEVTAAFVHARSPRLGSQSTDNQQSRCKIVPPDVRILLSSR
jgi:hypothetical protein